MYYNAEIEARFSKIFEIKKLPYLLFHCWWPIAGHAMLLFLLSNQNKI
jgi:hypothetical protein